MLMATWVSLLGEENILEVVVIVAHLVTVLKQLICTLNFFGLVLPSRKYST